MQIPFTFVLKWATERGWTGVGKDGARIGMILVAAAAGKLPTIAAPTEAERVLLAPVLAELEECRRIIEAECPQALDLVRKADDAVRAETQAHPVLRV